VASLLASQRFGREADAKAGRDADFEMGSKIEDHA
jgi:hypothetical protein